MAAAQFDRCEQAVAAIRAVSSFAPAIGVVLGSGLGACAEMVTNPISIPYEQVPHFPVPTVPGHRGRMILGEIGKARVAVLEGRFHFYEGHDPDVVTLPVRVLKMLGASTLVLTAAVGGLVLDWQPGELVLVRDHLNLFGLNPLRGPNDERFGPRFPDMTEVYSRRLRALAHAESERLALPLRGCEQQGTGPSPGADSTWESSVGSAPVPCCSQPLREGTYAYMPGPSYETPAEIRALRALGADVVGMSTVPEAIVARHQGMEVLAIAAISNWAAGISTAPISHEEVMEVGRRTGPRLAALLGALVTRL